MSIIEAVREISDDQAREWAKAYYGKNESPAYSGAYFEILGASESEANRLTAGDLYSIRCLAVHVPTIAGIDLLETQAERVNGLLQKIPSDRDLRSVTKDEYETLFGSESAAQSLWNILRAVDRAEGRWGIGPTRASKIMARKRPGLIPIEDSVVNRVIGLGRGDSWRTWWEALCDHGDELETLANVVRAAAERPDLSTLRALDVALWMKGRSAEGRPGH